MKIHELTTEEGLVPVVLRQEGGVLCLVTGDRAQALPEGAVAAVMKRFGKPLDPDVELTEVDRLEIDGVALRHVRHLARYDVIARDFLVYGEDCVLATTAAGALAHLASVTARGRT